MGKPTKRSQTARDLKHRAARGACVSLLALLCVPLAAREISAQSAQTDLNLSPERLAVAPGQTLFERYSDADQRAVAIAQLKARLVQTHPADEAKAVFARLNAEATRLAILQANYPYPLPVPKPVVPVDADEAAALTEALARHGAGTAAVAELEALDARLATADSGSGDALLRQFTTVLVEARRLAGVPSVFPDWTERPGRIVSGGVIGEVGPVADPNGPPRRPGLNFDRPSPRFNAPATSPGPIAVQPPTVGLRPPVVGSPQTPNSRGGPRGAVGGGNSLVLPAPPPTPEPEPVIVAEPVTVSEPEVVAEIGGGDDDGALGRVLPAEISAYLPVFTPFPPPAPSARAPIARALFEDEGAQSLGDVSDILEDALARAEYQGSSYLGIPGGFALVTQIEQTDSAGTPLDSQARWLPTIPALRGFTLRHYLQALFGAPAGYFRGIAIFVTDQPIDTTPEARGQLRTVEAWSDRGRRRLPDRVASTPLTDDHTITVYIYEFRKRTDDDVETIDPSGISARDHLAHTTLAEHVRDF